MLHDRYLKSQPHPLFDAAVTEALDPELDGGGNRMVIAIEDESGDVYRVIETHGLGAYMHTVHGLLALGFADKLATSLQGEGGYDSRLSPLPDLLAKCVAEAPDSDESSVLQAALDETKSLPNTERQAILQSRIGQGSFRASLIDYWRGCAVTGATCLRLLRASHIKPWHVSSNIERLDPFNGLLLAPNIDAAFDAGLISFDDSGRIQLSRRVSGHFAYELHISPKLRINPKLLRPQHREYLAFHRGHVFSDA